MSSTICMRLFLIYFPADLNIQVSHTAANEAPPQTGELRKYVIHCLRRSDAGYWMLDAGRRSRL